MVAMPTQLKPALYPSATVDSLVIHFGMHSVARR